MRMRHTKVSKDFAFTQGYSGQFAAAPWSRLVMLIRQHLQIEVQSVKTRLLLN